MAMNILRQQTAEEKKDFYDVNAGIPQDEFLKHLRKIEKEYGIKRTPFCARCAKFDFEDDLDKFSKELHRTPIKSGEGIMPKFISKRRADSSNIIEYLGYTDLSKYADPARFELLSESEAKEDHVTDGRKQKIKVGTYLNFQCKERGCRHTLTLSNQEYDERKAKAKGK